MNLMDIFAAAAAAAAAAAVAAASGAVQWKVIRVHHIDKEKWYEICSYPHASMILNDTNNKTLIT